MQEFQSLNLTNSSSICRLLRLLDFSVLLMSNEICICEKGIRLIELGNTLVSLWIGMWLDGGM